MLNTELLKPANFITIGLVSILFTVLIFLAFNNLQSVKGES